MFQIEVWKSQEYFVYFKIFKPISWGERPAERRSRLIQRFLNHYSILCRKLQQKVDRPRRSAAAKKSRAPQIRRTAFSVFRYFLKKSKKRFFFGWLLSSADWSNCRSSSFCSRVRRVGVSTTTVTN